ncbi:MAG: hypothetical protein RL645_154 [Actinomycetota bacterium]|jgi:threonine/homoserine/homoserine lactone efflux protein
MNDLVQFAIVAGLLTVLPGIDTAQMLRAAIKGGPKLAYITLFGIALGVWMWGIAAAVGLSALLLASAQLYDVVRIIGAAYLLYIGVRMILDARKNHGLQVNLAGTEVKPIEAMLRAFTITMTNPKNGAFYVAVFPAFLPVDLNPVAGGLLLATIHNLEALIWFTMIIGLTQFFKTFFAKPRVAKWMETISGFAMIGFGAKLLLERH